MTPFESSVLASIEEMNVKMREWKRRLAVRLAAKQALSQMANSYCLEEDWRRDPIIVIAPSDEYGDHWEVSRKWVIRSARTSLRQSLAVNGVNCWVYKDGDEHGGVKRFDTPEEAYEEWVTKHRGPWKKAMKKLGWKFWGDEE